MGFNTPILHHSIAQPLLPSGQPCFCQIEVTLNSAQRVIVDDPLVSQTDDGLPFNAERFALQTLILRRSDFAAAIVGILSTELQLFYALVVLGAQTIHRIGRKLAVGAQFLDQFNRRLIRFQAGPAFLFICLSVVCDPELPNQQWHRQPLKH